MVTANESQQLPAWNLPSLNQKALLQLEQNYRLPDSMHAENLASLGPTNSNLCGLNIGQPNAVLGLFKQFPPYQNNIPCPTGNLVGNNSDMPSRKRFLIFDHSENQTKLFVSPSLCPQNQVIASKISASAKDSYKEVVSQVDQDQPFVEEKWDENHLNDEGEGEMVEDSEEINALLYSDSDDEYDYDDDDDTDGENDEVTSTPFTIEDCCNNKDKRVVEEQVASCDSSPKRRKLLDGSCKKSSLDLSKIGTKAKIHEALKILGNIIPGGLKSKDPLSIIEKAILHFETMKTEAQALGLRRESTAFP